MKDFINDIKHMSWLFKTMIISFVKGDFHEAKESYYLMKIHWNYKSKRIDK
jgi:hypothetical protein